MADREHLKRLINASGYAFQLAAEGVIGDDRRCASRVVAREHPWLHDGTGRSGFVDFVIEKGLLRLIVECKRTTDGDWLFLVPDASNREASIFDCHWTLELDDKHEVADWGPVHFRPTHPLAQFCCVRGQGEGQASFLDRIGSELIYATEAIASAELEIATEFHERTAVYIPTIVTNARLHVAEFATDDVNLTSGQIANCAFTEVGILRYRKALDPIQKPGSTAKSIRDMNARSQRSVFVINIEHLAQLVDQLEIVQQMFESLPWTAAEKRFQAKRGEI